MAKHSDRKLTGEAGAPAAWQRVWRTAAGSSWERLKPCATAIAVIWITAIVLELTLNLLVPRTALRSSDLPIGARFFLFCYSLTALTFFLFSMGALIKLAAGSVHRLVPARLASLGRGVEVLLVGSVLILYGASWGLFWQTGSFLDSQVFIFLGPHPLQVFHWVDLDVALVIIAGSAAGTLAIVYWIPRWTARQSASRHARILRIWRRGVGVCLLGSLLGHLYSAWDERRNTRSGIVYARNRDNYSGPFAYIINDVKKYILKADDDLAIDPGFEIQQRSIIPLDQYRTLASQGKFHRWNVVILMVESLRADQLRIYGAGRNAMPAVEALAAESRVFLNAYSQSSHSNYATITPLSSHYPLRSASAYTYPKNPSYPRVLIYDLLKALGYRTAIFSSSNENWGGMVNYLETGNLDRFLHAANSRSQTYVMQGDAGFAAWVRETKHAGSLDDRATVDQAIEWIDGLGNEAFFVALNFQNSHLPYPIPPDFPRRFGPPRLDFTIRFAHFPRNKIQIVKDVYADSLAYVDAQIARLIQHLKANHRWDNTVVVLTGDHGQAFYEHGFASHASAIYDEVMKVPLIMRAPGLDPGLDRGLAQHVDIAPSIVGLLGLPHHPSFQGIDLFAAPPSPKRSVYMVAQTPDAYQYGIVRSGLKLIYDERRQEYLLFDLSADPGEKNNLASSRGNLVKELANRLNAWRKLQIDYYSDPALHTREYPPILKD